MTDSPASSPSVTWRKLNEGTVPPPGEPNLPMPLPLDSGPLKPSRAGERKEDR